MPKTNLPAGVVVSMDATVTVEDFEANTLFCQIVHRTNQMTQVAAAVSSDSKPYASPTRAMMRSHEAM